MIKRRQWADKARRSIMSRCSYSGTVSVKPSRLMAKFGASWEPLPKAPYHRERNKRRMGIQLQKHKSELMQKWLREKSFSHFKMKKFILLSAKNVKMDTLRTSPITKKFRCLYLRVVILNFK